MSIDKTSLKLRRSTEPPVTRDTIVKRVIPAEDVYDDSLFEVAGTQYRLSFRHLFDIAADGMCIIDTDFNIIEISQLLKDSIQIKSPLKSPQKCFEIIGGAECHQPQCPLTTIKENNQPIEQKVTRGFGKKRNYILSCSPIHSSDGTLVGIIEHFKDITEIDNAQKLLEEKIEELELEKNKVNQKNSALNELLLKLEQGKKEMSGQVRTNLDHMVFPILETIRTHIDPAKKNLVSVLASCLEDISEPFITTLQYSKSHLSIAESEICSMIREGFTTKQIANLRGVATATVIDQRKAIRKKLGIAKSDTNLTTYLKSLQHRTSD